MNQLFATVLDLDAALGGNARLLIGGGLGLYLKQEHLRQIGARTRLPLAQLPPARTTQDIDLFLRAEVIASEGETARYRAALDSLGFVVVEDARWMKFRRSVQDVAVEIDLMVGPLGPHAPDVRAAGERARPKGLSGERGLHARLANDAVGVEAFPVSIPVTGHTSDGREARCEVLVPLAFSYAVMKLGALRDRIDDPDKQEGRHHAMDLYRIIGMLTEQDEAASRILAVRHADDPAVQAARLAVTTLLAPRDGLGRIRLLEYARQTAGHTLAVDPDLLVSELRRLLASGPDAKEPVAV